MELLRDWDLWGCVTVLCQTVGRGAVERRVRVPSRVCVALSRLDSSVSRRIRLSTLFGRVTCAHARSAYSSVVEKDRVTVSAAGPARGTGSMSACMSACVARTEEWKRIQITRKKT